MYHCFSRIFLLKLQSEWIYNLGLGAGPDLNSCIDVTTSYHRDGSTWIVTFYFDPAIWIDCPGAGSCPKRRISNVGGLSSGCATLSAIFRVSLPATTCCATGCPVACLWNASEISICESAIARTTSYRWTSIWSVGSCASATSRASGRATASVASCSICDRWRSARSANDSPCATSATSSATAACGGRHRRVRTSATTWWTVCRSATCSCSWTCAADCNAARAVAAAAAARVAATAACPRALPSRASWMRTRGSSRTSCSWTRCCSTRSRRIPTRCCSPSPPAGRRPPARSAAPPLDSDRRSTKFRTLLFDYLPFLFHQLKYDVRKLHLVSQRPHTGGLSVETYLSPGS